MRRILGANDPCAVCGLLNRPGDTHCAACGSSLGTSGTPTASRGAAPSSRQSPSVQAAPVQAAGHGGIAVGTTPHAQQKSLRAYFGWKSVDGTVIHIGQSGLIKAPTRWWKLILKLLVGVGAVAAFGMLALAVIAALFVMGLLISIVFGRRERQQRGGFVQSVASQVVGYVLTSKLLGQKPMLPVCDYRLRDANGQEHLIRLEGYLRTGGIAVGDDITAEGYDRHGTLVMQRGWNRRLGTVMLVKDA